MKRRNFVELIGLAGGVVTSALVCPGIVYGEDRKQRRNKSGNALRTDLVIAGGGMGGCACALAALRNGMSVVMTEETDWIGGQLTQQGVPPDEHRWIESHGATRSYMNFRKALRQYYQTNYPLTPQALKQKELNPGNGAVSRLCAEPTAGVAVLTALLAPWISSGKLTLLLGYRVKEAEVDKDQVKSLWATNKLTGRSYSLVAPYFADATEMGDLLPMTRTAYVTGTESRKQTGELHAPEQADPDNQQAFTLCFALGYEPGRNNVISKPEKYEFWKSYIPALDPVWPGPLFSLTYSKPSTLEPVTLGFHPEGNATGSVLNLWNYRKIIDRNNFTPGFFPGDISIINWPQNDYLPGKLIDVGEDEFKMQVDGARQLNLSLLYWLQTAIARPDGGTGWPGLRLRGDVMGTDDGMAKYPYIREARRIEALFTVLEEHVGVENRTLVKGKDAAAKAESFHDSVGVGSYYLDLHPTTKGNNYIDLPSLPFQIPLGALIPRTTKNLIPACKNIGTTHISNGCYRLHPVEWNIGEVVGMLTAFALQKKVSPKVVREDPGLLDEFQRIIRAQGVEISWPA
jgi:hypothetical protein